MERKAIDRYWVVATWFVLLVLLVCSASLPASRPVPSSPAAVAWSACAPTASTSSNVVRLFLSPLKGLHFCEDLDGGAEAPPLRIRLRKHPPSGG